MQNNAKLQAFSSIFFRKSDFRLRKKSLHFFSVLHRFLDHFLDPFISEHRSNLVIGCSANQFVLRTICDLCIEVTH